MTNVWRPLVAALGILVLSACDDAGTMNGEGSDGAGGKADDVEIGDAPQDLCVVGGNADFIELEPCFLGTCIDAPDDCDPSQRDDCPQVCAQELGDVMVSCIGAPDPISGLIALEPCDGQCVDMEDGCDPEEQLGCPQTCAHNPREIGDAVPVCLGQAHEDFIETIPCQGGVCVPQAPCAGEPTCPERCLQEIGDLPRGLCSVAKSDDVLELQPCDGLCVPDPYCGSEACGERCVSL